MGFVPQIVLVLVNAQQSISVDDWPAELEIIAGNGMVQVSTRTHTKVCIDFKCPFTWYQQLTPNPTAISRYLFRASTLYTCRGV